MPNKYKRSVKSSNPFKSTVDMPGAGGLFGASPAPGFRDYPETQGNVLPATKFADTDMANGLMKKRNAMRRSVETPNMAEEMGLQVPGTTKIVKGKNRYERHVKSSNTMGKDKI